MGSCATHHISKKFETKYLELRRNRERTNIMVVGSSNSGKTILANRIRAALGAQIGMKIHVYDAPPLKHEDILLAVHDAHTNGIRDSQEFGSVVLHGVIIAVDPTKIQIVSDIIKLFEELKVLIESRVYICLFFTREEQGSSIQIYHSLMDASIYKDECPPPVYYAEFGENQVETPRKTLYYTIISMVENIVVHAHKKITQAQFK